MRRPTRINGSAEETRFGRAVSLLSSGVVARLLWAGILAALLGSPRHRRWVGYHDSGLFPQRCNPGIRHSLASRALELGESLPVIGRLLGHRDIEATARYAHLPDASLHETAERIAESIADEIL